MKLSLLLIVPIIASLLAATAAFVGPSPQSLGKPEGGTSLSAPRSLTPPAQVADPAGGFLPDGLTGRLTVRRGDELIMLQAPEMHEIDRRPDNARQREAISTNGRSAAPVCGEQSCDILISGPAGERHTLQVGGLVIDVAWAPDGQTLAYSVWLFQGGSIAGGELVVSDLTFDPQTVYEQAGPGATPFAWLANGDILVAVNDAQGASLRRVRADGTAVDVARMDSGVSYFYPSADATRVAFTQDGLGGWRLATFDAESARVHDLGAMGSGTPGAPPSVSPEQKGPMYVAWSADGTKIAFGGGYAAPYFMTVVDVVSGAVTRTEFPFGYPGEIKWSHDGATIAVSTYDPDRTRHEVYIVDPETGASRHLIAGCVIVWSPDGRFLALHAEKADGTAIIDVTTGEYGAVGITGDVPVAWAK